MDYPDELIALVKPGARLRVLWGPERAPMELRHIVAIVDEDQVVYKVWQPHRRRWSYQVEWMYGFLLAWEDGRLIKS